jgi:hypothetical protein
VKWIEGLRGRRLSIDILERERERGFRKDGEDFIEIIVQI